MGSPCLHQHGVQSGGEGLSMLAHEATMTRCSVTRMRFVDALVDHVMSGTENVKSLIQ